MCFLGCIFSYIDFFQLLFSSLFWFDFLLKIKIFLIWSRLSYDIYKLSYIHLFVKSLISNYETYNQLILLTLFFALIRPFRQTVLYINFYQFSFFNFWIFSLNLLSFNLIYVLAHYQYTQLSFLISVWPVIFSSHLFIDWFCLLRMYIWNFNCLYKFLFRIRSRTHWFLFSLLLVRTWKKLFFYSNSATDGCWSSIYKLNYLPLDLPPHVLWCFAPILFRILFLAFSVQ